MNAFVDKVAELLPALEARGRVFLFAFAEREDVPLWDVVISSAWSDEDEFAAIRFVAELLKARLEPREMAVLSRIAVIPSSDERIQDLPRSLDGVVPADDKVIYVSLLGSEVRRAFIFKGQRPPAASPSEPLIGAAAVHV